MTLRGFDYSNNNADLDFRRLRGVGRVHFAIGKVSQGNWFTDRTWTAWRRGAHARAAGLRQGGYHMPEFESVTSEFNHFWSAFEAGGGYRRGDIPVTVDFELANRLSMRENYLWLGDFARFTRRKTGRGIQLYGSPNYIDEHLWSLPSGCTVVWVAAYPQLVIPWAVRRTPNARVIMHQWSQYGRLPGASGYSDLDIYFGTGKQMASYCNG